MLKLKQYGTVNKSLNRITERDEFGNADIIGMDMTDLLELDTNSFLMVTDALNKLAEYEDIRDTGQMVALPVPIEEKIYEVIKECNMVISQTVYGYRVDGGPLYFYVGSGVFLNTNKIGETIFFTREEAEEKLKELEDKSDNV